MPKRKFYHLSRAWYGEANLSQFLGKMDDEINLGYYSDDGGTTGEFSIRWIPLGGESCPCIVAFSDAWNVLCDFAHVISEMTLVDNPTPSAVCEILLAHGFEDATPTESPYPEPPPNPLYRKPTRSV